MRKLPVIILLIVIGGVLFMGHAREEQRVSNDTALSRNLNTFNTITRYLAEVYVDSLRPDAAFDAAIGAMLNTVDPYTEYYNSDRRATIETMTSGAWGGIGAYIMSRDGDTYISLPIEDTPSFKSGLKSGDRILKVDTTDVVGRTSDFTTKLLKGDPGTQVTVVVERPYVADSILTFNIMRERVQDRSVPYYGVIDGVGFIHLSSFQEKSAREVRTALESFKENPDVAGVVLDLRENGGGLVESAIDILGMFLPRKTKVLELKGNDPSNYKAYVTKDHPILPDMPLVVLIDEGSASASEITAGAIQDLDRGLLVGQRSFGKGLVQSTLSLPYDGLLKVTTAKYHLPSGRMIQALDYSRRNPDGTVARTPDSLANEFKTLRGRTVKDGGGLMPDTVTAIPEYSRLLYNLMLTNQLFDYATKYAATHPDLPKPEDFRVTDEIYADFVAFVDTTKIKSDKVGERMVEELGKTAETEGFMSDELKALLEAMTPLVAPDLQRDLYNRRDEISQFLGREIVNRYYNRRGEERYMLNYDNDFEIAKAILKNRELYDSLLRPR